VSASGRTAVFRGRTRGVAPHTAPLSVHTTLRGREVYLTRLGRHRVAPGRLLILNAGQSVRTWVPTGVTDSVSVLFSPALAADVTRCLALTEERLLESPEADTPSEPAPFVEQVYPIDPRTSVLLETLARAPGPVAGAREEALHVLLERMLVLHRGLRPQIARVPALRASTRLEIYRRLSRARDLLDASPDRSVPLHEVARVACIAPHRLIRLFRDTFGETPHRYSVRVRVAHAARLLGARDRPVAEVARAVGFESVGSFSTLFRRLRGMSPGAARRSPQKGNFREA
jgi:AraC family transcriptional regulator